MSETVQYTITPRFPEAHRFEVTCRIERPDPKGQRFSLPVWIPGSYLVREFARHIVSLHAETDEKKPVAVGWVDKSTWKVTESAERKALAVEKIDKASWRVAPCPGPLIVTYQVYAWDLSVRAAHLDATHGFFNGASVFLRPHGLAHLPCRVEILPPPEAPDWQVATALQRDEAPPWGFGSYRADHYEDLIEHPVEMGRFACLSFEVRGIPHHLVVTGAGELNEARLRRDLTAICDWQMRLFGAPDLVEPYWFMLMAVGSGYGGLEHRNASALLCDRADLPPPGLPDDAWPEGYVRFLGLASHEYFHRWNVRRIRPSAFLEQDGSAEAYTRLLWFFEGVTSYYDDLCLKRAGLIDEATYLKLLAKTLTQVQKTPGRAVQSLEESSFDAWIKFYRPDENSQNSGVSYYAKGALVALCLDLSLRRLSPELSLDTLMRALWRRFGANGDGLAERAIFHEVAILGAPFGEKLHRQTWRLACWLETAVSRTTELPLETLLRSAGVRLDWKSDDDLPWLGVQIAGEGDNVRLKQVRLDSPAERAGLAAGDEIVALQEHRATRANWEKILKSLPREREIQCHYFRHERLATTRLTPESPPAETASLTPLTGAAATAHRQTWLTDHAE